MSGSVPALSQGGVLAGIDHLRLPTLVTAAGERAATRFLEFFASTIRNPHTRRAYARAVMDFLAWCDEHAVPSIAAAQPLHVAAWIKGQTREQSAPTVKQQLAAIRHLFDWLVMGQVVPLNPAASVRGPAHSVHKGKTPVLEPAEARAWRCCMDSAGGAVGWANVGGLSLL